jgi:hypothetical protein
MTTTTKATEAVTAALAALDAALALVGQARHALEMEDRDVEAAFMMDAAEHCVSAQHLAGLFALTSVTAR